ncbi:MAG TPA: hypothetical protein VNO43_13705 [Candidatus Eisenbacteria bacterium]|nr:hypothetical protein [Candidatus Eisenbacteria bacterium]
MEKNREPIVGQEPLDEEDPNIANLLVSKSERAPAADAEPATGRHSVVAAVKGATGVAVAALLIWRFARRLFSKSKRYRGGMY